jgi:ankyrin repeat protein
MAPRWIIDIVSTSWILGLFWVAVPVRAAEKAPLKYSDPAARELRSHILDGRADLLKAFVEKHGANDCLEIDAAGRTALHEVVNKCSLGDATSALDLLQILASRSGCINAPDRNGILPILELGRYLSWKQRVQMDALSGLIQHGADVNAQDENGFTLLHRLLSSFDSSMPKPLEMLLKAKANPNSQNNDGNTCLHLFLDWNGPLFLNNRFIQSTRVDIAQKVVSALLKAGADLSIRNKKGTTALGTMLESFNPNERESREVFYAFMQKPFAESLNLNKARIENAPALMIACDAGSVDPDFIETLLNLGIDPNQGDEDKFTALHAAAWHYNHEVCAALINHGAKVTAVTVNKRTVLHVLARSKYFDTTEFEFHDRNAKLLKTATLLVKHGADRTAVDENGKQAWQLMKYKEGTLVPRAEDMPSVERLLRESR